MLEKKSTIDPLDPIVFHDIKDAIKSNNLQYFHDFIANGNNINIKNYTGHNPLHFAVENNCHTMIEPLINLGVDINAQDNEGYTPLHNACFFRSYDSCIALINAGANVNMQDSFGYTPIHFAINFGVEVKFLQLLVDYGADITIPNFLKNSLLHTAINQRNGNSFENFLFLIESGAPLEYKNKYGELPVHVAVTRPKAEFLEALINSGIDYSIQNTTGNTPLHISLNYKNNNCSQLLLKQKIDFSLLNIDHENVFHISATEGYLDTFLIGINSLDFHKNIMQLNKDNENVLDIAKKLSKTNIVNFLNTYNEYYELKNGTESIVNSQYLSKKSKI